MKVCVGGGGSAGRTDGWGSVWRGNGAERRAGGGNVGGGGGGGKPAEWMGWGEEVVWGEWAGQQGHCGGPNVRQPLLITGGCLQFSICVLKPATFGYDST